jgi:hypothetical protein
MQVSEQYAKAISNSKRVRWEIDSGVIRGRDFDYSRNFLPSGLSLVDEISFLTDKERLLVSQIQGRTYCYLFGLVERFIAAKVLGVSANHWFGNQVALEALVRMAEEELKHQELFRRLEEMMAAEMPAGYERTADPDAVASFVLGKGTWAVLALTLHIELFTLAHYRASIGTEADICPLWKDVFRAHWQEESQHAVLDELEFLQEDERLPAQEREAAVGELIELVVAVDGLLQQQAHADAAYFGRVGTTDESLVPRVEDALLKAYRWQYIVSGVMQPRFQRVLFGTLEPSQQERIGKALEPLMYARPAEVSPVTAEA